MHARAMESWRNRLTLVQQRAFDLAHAFLWCAETGKRMGVQLLLGRAHGIVKYRRFGPMGYRQSPFPPYPMWVQTPADSRKVLVRATGRSGQTALHCAAVGGHVDMALDLLAADSSMVCVQPLIDYFPLSDLFWLHQLGVALECHK